MTHTCPMCDGPVQIFDDNGAEYPETRVEWFRCQTCNHEFRKVLSA